MVFTSFAFAALLAVTLPLYHVLPRRGQNVLLLAASYVFYGWWDWRFLGLLLFSTVLDYVVGLMLGSPSPHASGGEGRVRGALAQSTNNDRVSDSATPSPLPLSPEAGARETRRTWTLRLCVIVQLLLLGVFKYYDFFIDSLHTAFASQGVSVSLPLLRVVLPVGISFYTFHSLSYTIDIYRRQAEPTRDFIAYALFISFFPQLVAGPIARASHLLPQCLKDRVTLREDWIEGAYLFYWGLFKKVVVADNLALIVDRGFGNPGALNAGQALVVLYAFAGQIYCDFSGYTDMARGCAKWFGFDLAINFRVPYFAKDPSDFWQRWHISLSTWLRDYLYIPLGGNRGSGARTALNLFLTMLLGGLWHGANWTFVLWGAYHGALLIVYRLLSPRAPLRKASASRLNMFVNRIFFFHLVVFGWLLFRAKDMTELRGMLNAFTRWGMPDLGNTARLGLVLPVLVLEYLIYKTDDQTAFLRLVPWPVRAIIYFGMYWALVALGRWHGEGFIYFQF